MAEKAQAKGKGRKVRARRTAPKTGRAAGKRAAGERGRIALRRTASEYRAAAQEQAARVREEIEAALAQARSTREAIENRIAEQLHTPQRGNKARAMRKGGGRTRTARK